MPSGGVRWRTLLLLLAFFWGFYSREAPFSLFVRHAAGLDGTYSLYVAGCGRTSAEVVGLCAGVAPAGQYTPYYLEPASMLSSVVTAATQCSNAFPVMAAQYYSPSVCQWLGGTHNMVSVACVASAQGNIFLTSAGILRADLAVSGTAVCIRETCAPSVCSSPGTLSIQYLAASGTCKCVCAGGYSGDRCDYVPCTTSQCSGYSTGVAGTTNSPATGAGCTCTCADGYAHNASPTDCTKRYCRVATSCNGRADGVSGTFEPLCTCACWEQYGGADCEARICSKTHECGGNAIAVSGAYPNCQCACLKDYGGRDCRTLSVTASLSPTRSVSRSPTITPSASYSFSKSGPTASGSASLTLPSTASATRGPPTLSVTASHTLVSTASRSLLISASHTLSLSTTASITPSVTSSGPTVSPTAGPPSASLTDSRTSSVTRTDPSATRRSPSITATCRGYGDLNPTDVCEVLRPLPYDVVARAGHLLLGGSTTTANSSIHRVPDGAGGRIRIDGALVSRGGHSSSPSASSSSSSCNSRSSGGTPIIRVPFAQWSGRQGSLHTVAIVSIDSRIPLGSPRPPALTHSSPAASASPSFSVRGVSLQLLPFEANFSSGSAAMNATLSEGAVVRVPTYSVVGRDPTGIAASDGDGTIAIGTLFTAVVTIAYHGPNTLNGLGYTMDGVGCWALCPLATSGAFEVVLEPSDRLLPPILADIAARGASAVAAGNMLAMTSPTAVLQLGVMTALRGMSRCRDVFLGGSGDASDGADDVGDDDSYAGYREGVINPLGLALGKGGDGYRYLRGALLTSAAYAVLLSCALMLYALAGHRARLWVLRGASSSSAGAKNSAFYPPMHPKRAHSRFEDSAGSVVVGAADESDWHAGFPSSLVVVAAFAMDGAVGAGTMLGVYGANTIDVVCGWIAVAVVVVYVAHVLYVTTVGFPSERLVLTAMGGCDARPQSLSSSIVGSRDDFNLLDDDDAEMGAASDPSSASLRASPPAASPSATAVSGSLTAPTRLMSWLLSPTDEWSCRPVVHPPIRREGSPSNLTVAATPLAATITAASAEDLLLLPDDEASSIEMLPRLTTPRSPPPPPPLDAGEHHAVAAGDGHHHVRTTTYGDPWWARYEAYVGDSRVRWYCAAELAAALAVTLLGSLSYAITPFCVARGVLAAIVLGAQLLVMALLRPPMHRWRWLLLSAVLSLQLAIAVLSTISAVVQRQQVELAMDCLGVIVSVLLMASTGFELWFALGEAVPKIKDLWGALVAKYRCRRSSARHDDASAESAAAAAPTPFVLGDLLVDDAVDASTAAHGDDAVAAVSAPYSRENRVRTMHCAPTAESVVTLDPPPCSPRHSPPPSAGPHVHCGPPLSSNSDEEDLIVRAILENFRRYTAELQFAATTESFGQSI